MASTVQDLLVRIRPEGVQETTEQLGEQQEQFTETAETAEEQTGKLEAFSERWEGAMGTIVAGLGVAAAGLSSKVPVLGTALSGVNALLTSLGLQLDQFIRDLGVTGEAFFDAAEAVDSLEGSAGDAAGALFGVGSALGSIVAVAGAGTLVEALGLGSLGVTLGSVSSVAATAGSALATVASVFVGWPAAVTAVTAALGALALEMTGVIDISGRFDSQITTVKQTLDGAFNGAVSRAESAITDFGSAFSDVQSTVSSSVTSISSAVRSKLGSISNDAFQWGSDTIDRFVAGVGSVGLGVFNRVQSTAQNALNLANEGFEWGSRLIERFANGVSSVSLDVVQGTRNMIWNNLNPDSSKLRPFVWGRDLINKLRSGIRRATDAFQNRIENIRARMSWLLDPSRGGLNPFNWGEDLIDKIVLGIERSKKEFFESVAELRDFLDDQLSFDLVDNDRMAARWGSDFVQHFSAGMSAETGGLSEPRIEMPDVASPGDGGHSFAGRGEMIQTKVELDGREIARAVGDRQSSGVDFRGRF